MRVLSVVNQKGGVAKTTTCANMGACLARRGFRTLLLDLDPQANLTLGFGVEQSTGPHSLDKVLLEWDGAHLAEGINQIQNLPLWLAPGAFDMGRCEQILTPMIGSGYALRRALEQLFSVMYFDWVLIDCPPSLGRLTEIALMASTDIVIPTEAKYYSFAGIDTLNKMILRLMHDMMFDIRLLGVVMTMYEGGTRLQQSVSEEIKGRFGDKVFHTPIRRNTRLSESELSGLPVCIADPKAPAARDYEVLTTEMLDRAGRAFDRRSELYYKQARMHQTSAALSA